MNAHRSGRRRVLTGLVVVTMALLLSTIAAARSTYPEAADVPSTDAAVACSNLRTLAVNETLEQSALRPAADTEWIKFTVQENARYRLEVKNAAGLQLALHDRCSENAPAVALNDGQLEFTATSDGDYYLLVKRDGASGYQVTLSPAAPHRASSAPMADVPEALQRRALEFLEQLRGGDLAPEWRDARLNPEPRILYRPDMQEPAYYEFTVEKPSNGGYEPAGFIQLAAGEHDYVMTQWDMTGMSPTQELADLAPLGAELTEFYKLNSLSYVAEYEELTAIGVAVQADDVINLGDIPRRIEGLEAIPEEPAELVDQTIDFEGNETYEGPDELPLLEENGWDSWAALKDGYEEEYAPLLKSLKQRASEEWELENNLSTHGESLVKGDVRTVYGLPSQTLAAIDVTGEGAAAQYLQQEELTDNSTLTGLRLTVLDEPADPEAYLPIEVALEYTSGTTETVKYAIVNAAALPIHEVYLPFISDGSGNGTVSGVSAEAVAATSGWGPWHYYWAYGDAGANRYGQFSYLGCASGCGATAWAMLFGWTDRRAAVGAYPWSPHWGIYRWNGGLGGNVTAPLSQDNGVRNMTREIRNHIDTYCCGSGGCTRVTDMIEASEYVRPRVTTAWRMRTKYDPTGLCWFGSCDPARSLARYSIRYQHKPAIIAANNHYPLAYGYAWRKKTSCFLWWCSTTYSRWFYVNNGWYGNNNGWVNWGDVFFSGVYEDR
jgi:hypothetical protein